MRQVQARNPTAAGIVAGHSPEVPPGRIWSDVAAVVERFTRRQAAAARGARQDDRTVAARGAWRGDLLGRLEVVQVHAQDSTAQPPAGQLRLGNSSGRTGAGDRPGPWGRVRRPGRVGRVGRVAARPRLRCGSQVVLAPPQPPNRSLAPTLFPRCGSQVVLAPGDERGLFERIPTSQREDEPVQAVCRRSWVTLRK